MKGFRVPRERELDYNLFLRIVAAFGRPRVDVSKYINDWDDLMLDGAYLDHVRFVPKTPAGELWLLANLPTEATLEDS